MSCECFVNWSSLPDVNKCPLHPYATLGTEELFGGIVIILSEMDMLWFNPAVSLEPRGLLLTTPSSQ